METQPDVAQAGGIGRVAVGAVMLVERGPFVGHEKQGEVHREPLAEVVRNGGVDEVAPIVHLGPLLLTLRLFLVADEVTVRVEIAVGKAQLPVARFGKTVALHHHGAAAAATGDNAALGKGVGGGQYPGQQAGDSREPPGRSFDRVGCTHSSRWVGWLRPGPKAQFVERVCFTCLGVIGDKKCGILPVAVAAGL